MGPGFTPGEHMRLFSPQALSYPVTPCQSAVLTARFCTAVTDAPTFTPTYPTWPHQLVWLLSRRDPCA